jgi:hypothetical protein
MTILPAVVRSTVCGTKALLDPLWDLDKFRDQFYEYSGCKENEMWG